MCLRKTARNSWMVYEASKVFVVWIDRGGFVAAFQNAKELKFVFASKTAYNNQSLVPVQQFGVCRKWALLLLSPVKGQNCHKSIWCKEGRRIFQWDSGEDPKDGGWGLKGLCGVEQWRLMLAEENKNKNKHTSNETLKQDYEWYG